MRQATAYKKYQQKYSTTGSGKKISNTKIEIRILFGAQQTEGEMLFKGQGNDEV